MGGGTGIARPDGEMAFGTGSISRTSVRLVNVTIEEFDDATSVA